jgi:hypothetical protein
MVRKFFESASGFEETYKKKEVEKDAKKHNVLRNLWAIIRSKKLIPKHLTKETSPVIIWAKRLFKRSGLVRQNEIKQEIQDVK